MTDSYRPQYAVDRGPPPMPPSAQKAMYHFQGNPEPPRGPKGYQPGPSRRQNDRARRLPTTASRPLFRLRQDADNQSFIQQNAKSKFRDVDQLTDSEEEAMSQSEGEEEDIRPAKRLKKDGNDCPGDAGAPKWSNPDPYTALPPPSEATGKQKDVVKLIRKAKISDPDGHDENDLAQNADFISFDGGLDDMFVDVPTGPKADDPSHLGKRKRDQEDARPRQPLGYTSFIPILPEWAAGDHVDATPWLSPCSANDSAATALHKEIIDFYEWVRPQEYETAVRADILKRLSLSFNQIEPGELKPFGSYAAGLYLPTADMDLVYLQRTFKPGQNKANGLPPPPRRSLLEKFAKRLREKGLAREGSVLLIPFAKVPIIKFVDQVSGVRVDLSFNNDSGIVANETFQKWKSQYPAMPILVSIIKQFLMLRGLNDVSSGGLGGFSVICLVTSILQHLPGSSPPANLGQILLEFFNVYGNLIDKEKVAVRLDPPGYIDKALYKPHLFNKDKVNRLTIIDPNRPENNISGGTHLIGNIQSSLSLAYDLLQERLATFTDTAPDAQKFSFLGDLVGANFLAYENQRKISRDLYFGLTGRNANEPQQRPPPPPPSSQAAATQHPIPGSFPPPPPATNGIRLEPTASKQPETSAAPTAASRMMNGLFAMTAPTEKKAERRANRLKTLRPELANRVGKTISSKEAVRIGGYEDTSVMERDLQMREQAAAKSTKK